MSSYGSISCKSLPCSARANNNSSSNGGDSSEITPLLSVPDHSFFPGSGGISITVAPSPDDGDDDSLLAATDCGGGHGYGHEQRLPILSKITSNTPLGIEAEAIPATASVPDAHNDFRLPRDDTLRYIATHDTGASADDCDGCDDDAQLGFHGGITRGQFWLIFTGRNPPPPELLLLLFLLLANTGGPQEY